MKVKRRLLNRLQNLEKRLHKKLQEFTAKNPHLGGSVGAVRPSSWQIFPQNPVDYVELSIWYIYDSKKHKGRDHGPEDPGAIGEDYERGKYFVHLLSITRKELNDLGALMAFFEEDGIETTCVSIDKGQVTYRFTLK